MKKLLLRILKITGIAMVSLLLLLFFLPLLFPGFVADKIKQWANGAITTRLEFSKARLSFFNHFPSLTLTLHDVTIMGSAPYAKDTLLNAGEVALGIDLYTVFAERIRINEIFLTDAGMFIKVDENGGANYNVYRADTTQTETPADSTGGTSLKIEKIEIQNCSLSYNDLSIPIIITAENLDYIGKGDLSKAIFDLSSNINVASFNLMYDSVNYIHPKKLKADLITKINTNSLAFEFTKNDLLINTLPVDFIGRFAFLEDGYNMDFELQSTRGSLHDVFSALPPEYNDWLAKTEANGKTEMNAYLRGRYISDKNIMPDLGFKMMIRDGYINNGDVPSPVTNLFLNLDTQLPSLNTDSLYLNIDSIFFNIDKDYFSSVIKLNNLNRPTVHAKMNAEIDLEKWDKAFGIEPFNVTGHYSLHFTANGSYVTTVVQKGIRATDTIITSIPSFNLSSSLSNGSFKYASLPQAVNNISFNLNASCPDSNYRHTSFSIEQVNATMMSDFIKGYFKVTELSKTDADIKAVLHLDNIKQYYPLEDIALAGNLDIGITSKGNYLPEKKQFPVTNVNVALQNGSIKTIHYPNPIENIQVNINVVNTKGTMADTRLAVQPASFLFEGNPFVVNASLQNFENIRYDVSCKGILDIGKLYRVFAREGMSVNGHIKTDLRLRGLQSDAAAMRYSRLDNSGTAEMQNIVLRSDYFPQPFIIKNVLFSFKQDKMWFNKFNAVYGQTNFSLNGYLSNVVNYVLQSNATLQGKFSLATPHFYVDEFMAFNSGDTAAATAADSTGVIVIPSNLDITLNAAANKITYQQLELQKFSGGVTVKEGKLMLNKTGFTLIDAPVSMSGLYASLSPRKAMFEYNIKADSFDVQRAYKEIKLFHDLATSAANIKGIVSLDYKLSGKLDANMYPIYPSLKGGGVLGLENVQVKGMKLFSAVSKETGKDSVNDPNLKKVNIKTIIENNIITLHKTKMKVFGFRPRFEGQVSFDGRLNLAGRLGLPPFGIFGIPFTVTGTQESPNVQLRRAKDSDTIEMTQEDADEEEE